MVSKDDIREYATSRGMVPSDEVQSLAGITYRQLDYWCRTGLLEYAEGESSGNPRMFRPREVAVAEMLGMLSERGLAPSSDLARRAAVAIRKGRGECVITDGPISIFVA